MASLMEELIQTLDAEEKCYSQLIPIEEEKTRAIIANDLETLQDITVREHDLVDETSALENKRERVAIDIATVLGRDPKTITLEQIASVLKISRQTKRSCRKCMTGYGEPFHDCRN